LKPPAYDQVAHAKVDAGVTDRQNPRFVELVCIIGAGSSGIASCQVLQARGIEFDCFEKGSGIGGNWRYQNDNDMSSSYWSLYINTSKPIMEYRAYPMPADYPDYCHHTQVLEYFEDYVDHFGFRDKIRFNTEVTKVERADDGGWDVTLDDGETRRYGAVLVANGHHWDPKWPDPPFPGEFHGHAIHSHDYKTAEGYEDKNVLVLGMGNSAMDIACETSRVARQTFLAARRGAHIIPKYLKGTPIDELGNEFTSRLPLWVTRRMYAKLLKQAVGDMEDYGLPKPDHKLAEAHPTVSSEILPAIGHGRVKPKPNIERLEGDSVRFVDGSVESVDRIVYCTGYKISFPFLSPELLAATDNEIPLYRRVVHPELDGLYFIGLLQPLGAIMPLAELQSHWVADLLLGEAGLPEPDEMRKVIEREDARMRKRYVKSTRHTIQVDFYPYMRSVERERKAGRKRPGRAAQLAATGSRRSTPAAA
jgi:dimethylaniline monooxygenase (N-oxide forming)